MPPSNTGLPGFGLPRKYETNQKTAMFPHALDGEGRGKLSKGVLLRERRMLALIGDITDKPDWHRKVFDKIIVDKWRAEAKSRPLVADNDVFMSAAMFEHVRFQRCRFLSPTLHLTVLVHC